MDERFFYHSFPRRFRCDSKLEISKGLQILRSIQDIGFVLTPEITEWSEPLMNGTLSEPWKVIQKRCCFTELRRQELANHSKKFGTFSLEFDEKTFRQLGGIPVFYLPRATSEDVGLESIGAALVARLGEIQTVLNRLADMEELVGRTVDKNKPLGVEKEGAKEFFRTSIGGAEDVIAFLTHNTQPVEMLRNALRVLSGFFYPTEDFKYTGPLAYYRQREWRFVANMSKAGVELNREPTPEEIKKLHLMDPDFFGNEMPFFTGPASCIEQCRIFSELEGKPIHRFATRIIVPEPALQEARSLFSNEVDPSVVALDESYGLT